MVAIRFYATFYTIISLILFATSSTLAAGRLEYGAIAGGLNYPAFPSSFSQKNRMLILPYVKYESKRFSVGSGSIAALHLSAGSRVKFDLSINGSFDASSAGVPARSGMPDLAYMFEAGPVLSYQLGALLGGPVEARFPLRAVFTTDLRSVRVIGATFSPSLRVKWELKESTRTELEATFQPVFATEGVQDYFYQVDAAYTTLARPTYNATGGYLGSELVLSVSHSLSPSLRVYGYAKFGLYNGNRNAASPLFGKSQTMTVGIAIRKTLGFLDLKGF